MATFLFRLGRLGSLKCLQLENLGILKSSPAALFCTKTEKPAKSRKKTKTAAAEAPDDRAILLAYKTAVAFPVRLSGPGRFPAQSVDGTGPAVVSTAESIVAAQVATLVTAASEQVAAESDPGPDPHVAAPPIVASPSPADEIPFEVRSKLSAAKDYTVATSSECGDAAADSDSDSTDSDSDSAESDSDSDSEDEKAEMKKEIKSFAPEAEPQRITVTEVKAGTNEAQNQYGAPITSGVETPAPLGAPQATVKVPSVGFEKLVKSGPEIIAATENTREVTGSDISAKTAGEVIKDAAFPVDAKVEALGEAVGEAVTLKDPRSSSAEAAAVAGGEAAEAGAEDALPAEAAAVAAAEASVYAGSTDEQMDLAPIVTETAGEELQTEATAEHSKEAAAVPSEPEELLDNSTYKNYQHHSYNPYTFADLDVEMAKFRLPQPSSGKPSPRH